jgi:hypothetical protein
LNKDGNDHQAPTMITRQQKGKRGLSTLIVGSLAVLGAIAALLACSCPASTSGISFL